MYNLVSYGNCSQLNTVLGDCAASWNVQGRDEIYLSISLSLIDKSCKVDVPANTQNKKVSIILSQGWTLVGELTNGCGFKTLWQSKFIWNELSTQLITCLFRERTMPEIIIKSISLLSMKLGLRIRGRVVACAHD